MCEHDETRSVQAGLLVSLRTHIRNVTDFTVGQEPNTVTKVSRGHSLCAIFGIVI
jgi:hypothetical protein